MDHDQARADLDSVVIRERLAAARFLARSATEDDSALLRERLNHEPVQWVRDALRAAISHAQLSSDSEPTELPDQSDLDAELRASAIVEVTAQLLHELEPLVGLLRTHLYEEWPDVRGTRSESGLTRLEEFLEVMTDLHTAAQVPVLREVELRSVMTSALSELSADAERIQLAGPELRVTTDPRLLRLLLRNALGNAIDAMSERPGDIVLAWGRSREGFFVSVVDDGVGLPDGFSIARVQSGTTTKQGHLGMGLTLIRQVAESLGAEVELTGRTNRGAKLELRCPDGA